MGVSLELDVEALAHRRASAVAADQIGRARYRCVSGRRLDLDLDAIVVLLEAADARREFTLAFGSALQPLDRHVGELVLLALHDIRIARVVLQHAEIEFGDDARGWHGPRCGISARSSHAGSPPRPGRALPAFPSVAACVVAARGMSLTRASASNSRTSNPCRASASAVTTPTGPPPAMTIGRSDGIFDPMFAA